MAWEQIVFAICSVFIVFSVFPLAFFLFRMCSCVVEDFRKCLALFRRSVPVIRTLCLQPPLRVVSRDTQYVIVRALSAFNGFLIAAHISALTLQCTYQYVYIEIHLAKCDIIRLGLMVVVLSLSHISQMGTHYVQTVCVFHTWMDRTSKSNQSTCKMNDF